MDNVEDYEDIVSIVNNKLNEGFTLAECAISFGVHRMTLDRWLKRSNTWTGAYPELTVDDTCWLIEHNVPLRGHGSTWGIRMIHDHLRRLGYRISRLKVRTALHQMMPDVLQWRRQHRLIRRDYDVYEPMHVWHIDSHDKLARWGFRIHGCIDGATHYVVYMLICLDKKAKTIFAPYKQAILSYGHPLIIRSDYASEHCLIQENITRARPNTRAFRQGPSVHNQRIEHFWRFLREKVTNYYQQALVQLSHDEGCLEIVNPYHRTSVVKVFLPVIKAAVADFVTTWNNHRVRTTNERGRYRPGHIPQMAFQANERKTGIILPPPYPVEANLTFIEERANDGEPTDVWNHNADAGEFEAGMNDVNNEVLQRVRDLAYECYKDRLDLITCKFKLHVALTYECKFCLQANMFLDVYVQQRLSEANLTEDTYLALMAIQEVIEGNII